MVVDEDVDEVRWKGEDKDVNEDVDEGAVEVIGFDCNRMTSWIQNLIGRY